MKIYELTQISMERKRYTDFDLPKHLGFYITRDLAEATLEGRIQGSRDEEIDYEIRVREVITD